MKYNLYVERPGYVMPPKRLTDEEYAAAIARFPRVCADVIPINREHKTIYLAQRKLGHPSGWWWIGGALNAGELPEKAAQRNLKRETSLKLPLERFNCLPHLNFYIWIEKDCEQKNLGCNDIIFCYLIEPSVKEITQISKNLDKTEYEKNAVLKEFTRKDIGVESGFNKLARKAILELYDEVFPI